MLDIGTNIREAYTNTLQGYVSINAKDVPFVDEKMETNISETDVYVLFIDQNEDESIPNKTVFVNENFLRMRIVARKKATNTKEVVEDVARQILQRLFPDRMTWNVALSSPLYLTYARYVGGTYNPMVQTTDGFVISKTLTFKNRITQ